MPSQMALFHSTPTGWRLFFIILLPLCWITGLLLRQSYERQQQQQQQHHRPPSPPSEVADFRWRVKGELAAEAAKEAACAAQEDAAQSWWSWEGYSIKPVVYVFPQFHPIPENDEFWGEGFTEWTNVLKVATNRFGLETLRPAPEVGYYNLLDYETRERMANFVKDSRIYGLVYHHYWFGYPVMDKPLQAILGDGQPDVPFMLSWANEPWTSRWDGHGEKGDDGVLLAQEYGDIEDWRRHFDWMAPFFRHRNYIRNSAGDAVQVMIYSPLHVGDVGRRMFEAWKVWARADPFIGELEIIETHINGDPHDRGQTKAMAEFGGRSSGLDDAALWRYSRRLSTVFHRSTRLSWDNTPRHATDGKGGAEVWVHPDLWKINTIEQLRRIKLDPNPPGEENFFFINSLNEWGEGNVFEPSMQWGDKFSQNFREAMDYADGSLPWAYELVERSERLAPVVADEESEVNVCVIVREFNATYPFQGAYDLSATLRSLQAQSNERWRAVVVPVQEEADAKRKARVQVLDAWDPRIALAEIPGDILKYEDDEDGLELTDWVIANMESLSPPCARATYMLIADSTDTYEPETFDLAVDGSGDLIGLNFVSETTMGAANEGKFSWDQRCDRLEDGTAQYCQAMRPELDEEQLDLGAVLIDMGLWVQEGIKLRPVEGRVQEGRGARVLKNLTRRPNRPWSWKIPEGTTCHHVHTNTYPWCVKIGWIWVDVPSTHKFMPKCHRAKSLMNLYGMEDIPIRWDYERFKEKPFCVRLSEARYEEVLSEEPKESGESEEPKKPKKPEEPQKPEEPEKPEEAEEET